MDIDQARRLARGLKGNALLTELLEARADEIRQAWESEDTAAGREVCWLQLKATQDLRDYLNARITDLARREPGEK